MAYNAAGRLRVEVGTPIYECNKICKCDKDCTNRVVQKGRKVSNLNFRNNQRSILPIACFNDESLILMCR